MKPTVMVKKVKATQTNGSLMTMVNKAFRLKLFFYSRERSFDLWLSPGEMKTQILKGAAWINREWQLKDPQLRVMEIEKSIYYLREELNDLKQEISSLRLMND